MAEKSSHRIPSGRRQLIQEMVNSIRENYRPERIILFGSSAEDGAAAHDVDLLIIKNTDRDPWERLAEVDRYITHAVPVDVLVYTPDEVDARLAMNDFFVQNVIEKGVVLHDTRG